MAITQRVIMSKRKRMTKRNKRKNIKVSSGGIGTPPVNRRVLKFTDRGVVEDNSSFTRTKHKVGTKSESTFGFGEEKNKGSPRAPVVKEESGWGFGPSSTKKENIKSPLNYRKMLDLKNNEYNKDHILAIFIPQAASIKMKDHYKLNLGTLNKQFYKKLMTPAHYEKCKEALKGISDKFNTFIDDVTKTLQYQPFSNKTQGKINIDTLDDWVKVFEILYGFEAQYKQYLLGDECITPSSDTLKDITTYCNGLPEAEKNKFPNPCSSKKGATLKNAVLRALSIKKKAPLNKAQQISLLRRENPKLSIDEAAELLMKKN